jgi:predicted permease
MTESLVLAAGGGVLGVLCAGWGLDALVASNPEPPPYWVRLAVDGRILGFCAALSVLTAIACGLLPALRVSRTDSSSGALHGGRAGASPAQRRLQGALVVGQIALSFSLLVGATLLAKSTLALQQADAGFDPRPLLSLRLYMAGDTHETPAARARALNAAIGRISTLPGVAGAGAIGAIPGDDGGDGIRLVPERGVSAPGEEIGAQAIPVASDVFGALGLQLIEGRAFTAAEVEQPEADVIVVNARLAARFWPGQSAIGRTLRIVEPQRTTACRIVGVAPDLVYEELGEETAQSQLNVYVPYARAGWRTMALLVRTPGNPAAVTGGVRGAVRATDPAFAAFDVMTMTERRLFTSWGERFVGRTFGAFAIAALLLACVGAYGLTAYAAAQRTREIGLRVAIGATRRAILQLLLARAVRLAAIGWLAGLPLAFASARLVQGLLFRVSPWTAEVWGLLPLALLGMVLLASFLPARRASLTDPATALRQD